MALEILATVPTVVTFLFVLVLFPVRMTSWAQTSLMALPFVFMEAPRLVLSADRLTATVTGERDAAIALGATTSAALRYVVFPAVRLPLGGLLARTSARLLGGASALVLTLHALATGTADALARVLPAVLILTATCCALGAMAAWCFARSHLNEVTDE